MNISSAYIFAKQIKAGTVPPDPIVVFESGTWNREVVGQYWQTGGAYAPKAPGVFTTIRPTVMAEYGKDAYNSATNLYVLGSRYQNIYTLNQTNISRSCTTGTSIDQSGASVFIPFTQLAEQRTQIVVEYKITNANSFSKLLIGGLQVSGDAYVTVAEDTGTDTGDWQTLTVTMPSAQVLDGIEIQTTYGSYEIRKITLL